MFYSFFITIFGRVMSDELATIETLLGVLSRLDSSGLKTTFHHSNYAYRCNLKNGELEIGKHFPKKVRIPTFFNHISHIYALVHPHDLKRVFDATEILFNMILEKGLDESDTLYVTMRIKTENVYSWYLRTSQPMISDDGVLCNLSKLTCLEGIYSKAGAKFGWQGETFSNIDFITSCKEKWLNAIFTKKEIELLAFSVSGLKMGEIAEKTNTSFMTVKTHFQNMRRKTNTQNRTQLHNYYRTHSDINLF